MLLQLRKAALDGPLFAWTGLLNFTAENPAANITN